MHTRVVIVLGRLVELHEAIVPGANPLSSINSARHQVLIDLATRQRYRRGAQLGHDITAKTRDTHLESLEVIGRIDLLAEPATHLYASVTARHTFQPEFTTHFIP